MAKFRKKPVVVEATQWFKNGNHPKEHKHPKYQEARDAELAEVKAGNYNFEGIGRPADL